MKRILYPAALLLLVSIFNSCSSGKAALKHGDYYDAVLESVKRLQESPHHKKAIAVLTQSYPLAIDYIETSLQNGIKSDDPRKWRNAVEGYNKINFINDQIKTSLGAMKVITNPQTRFKELADAKVKAAEEAYNEGINEMMKSNREDTKQAYYDFRDANNYQPGYKESIEMMTQAEFVATLRVAFEEINNSSLDYGSFQPLVSSLQRLFLSFKPIAQKDTVPPQQYLRISFNGYQPGQPYTSTSSENVSREIKVGEKKTADGKTQDVMQTITAKVTYYRKSVSSVGRANVSITDAKSNSTLQNFNVDGRGNWDYTWANYSGDSRALGINASSLVKKSEAWPNDQDLYNEAMNNLKSNLSQQLKSYYSQF